MILQSLISLYDNRRDQMPPFGYSYEDIGFVVNIDRVGNMLGDPEDLRDKEGANDYKYRKSLVPYTNQVNVRSRSAAETPNFLVDKADYIFGMSGNARKDKHHESFKALVEKVCIGTADEGIWAVKNFLKRWIPEDSTQLTDWREISGTNARWVAFKLEGDRCFIHERPEVRSLWDSFLRCREYPQGICLINGEKCNIQRQYAQFKFGSGASLVSFNESAYESYGKKKGENAPISVEAEFKSSAALKYLLRHRGTRLRIGEVTMVFWAERASVAEPFFGQALDPARLDHKATARLHKYLNKICQGSLPREIEQDEGLKFYILGFSVNKARLALRFWYVCSVGQLMEKLRNHFRNLEIERSSGDNPFPGAWHLLKETARESKNISPILAGNLTRAIITGGRYPENLLQGVVGRIRADHRVGYLRASIVKAVLTRNHKKEVPMALDPDKRDIAYLLGRLFAVLEKAQFDALGKINVTIKDRFFSAASATPATVFPRLLRLSQHHIEKAEYGFLSDRRIAELMEHIEDFPQHMNLKDQGLFAIAYYQQRNALNPKYKKIEPSKEGENE